MRCISATPYFARTMPRRVLVIFGGVCCALTGRAPGETRSTTQLESHDPPLWDVRILVAPTVPGVRFRTSRGGSVVDDGGSVLRAFPARKWVVVRATGEAGVTLGGEALPAKSVTVVADGFDPVQLSVLRDREWSQGVTYPGRIQISIGTEHRLDVINRTNIERYVECVVASEVWPTFATEAYRAQAVIARTYVLYQMMRRQGADWDITATQASQVYKGVRYDEVGKRAAAAADYSRGVVCVWQEKGEDRLFPTYYSSVCGGMSQSAAIFGSDDAIAPLAGAIRCDHCQIAPKGTYRWGPARINIDDLRARLIARYPEVAALRKLTRITVLESVPGGTSRRAVRLRITGSNDETYDMLAERFRLVVGSDVMRSTDCTIRLSGGEVIFENGRGYGHGLGLCQWGMHGQALAGKHAGDIIRYYYPGSRLVRVY